MAIHGRFYPQGACMIMWSQIYIYICDHMTTEYAEYNVHMTDKHAMPKLTEYVPNLVKLSHTLPIKGCMIEFTDIQIYIYIYIYIYICNYIVIFPHHRQSLIC